MKTKLITSALFGLLLPWTYFLLVKIQPLKLYDEYGNDITSLSTPRNGGFIGFLEFHGFWESLFVYFQAFIVCSLFIFAVCTAHEFISSKIKESE